MIGLRWQYYFSLKSRPVEWRSWVRIRHAWRRQQHVIEWGPNVPFDVQDTDPEPVPEEPEPEKRSFLRVAAGVMLLVTVIYMNTPRGFPSRTVRSKRQKSYGFGECPPLVFILILFFVTPRHPIVR